MIDKNKIFDLLLNGKEILISNDFQRKYLNIYNDIMLCREFGWTEQDILNTSQEFYNNCILLLQKENRIQKLNNKK